MKEMLISIFTNPYVIGGLIAGFALLFGSTIVQLALARQIAKSLNKGPGGTNVPTDMYSKGKGAGRLVRGLTIAAAAGYTIDAGAGLLDDGKDPDLEQDEKNWNKATTGEKIQSSIPRGIENIADFIGLSNMAAMAKKDRIAAETAYLANKKPAAAPASAPAPASPETAASASTPDAMRARAASIAQIKELTTALNQLDYNKLIIPETANKNIEINTGKMRLLRGEVNALTTSFKNLNDVGLSKITKGINSLSGEFKIFNDGFSIFKKRFEELDRTTERGLLETIGDKLDRLNTSAGTIVIHTQTTADTLSKKSIKTRPG